MIDEKMLPKAYKEVLEILKYIPREDYAKIPKKIIEKLEKEQDREYFYYVTEFVDFNKQKMLEETEIILSVFYTEYWADKEQKKIIYEIEMQEKRKIEEEKSKKYVPLNNIFQEEKIERKENIENIEKQLVAVNQENFFKSTIKKIIKFFQKKS